MYFIDLTLLESGGKITLDRDWIACIRENVHYGTNEGTAIDMKDGGRVYVREKADDIVNAL